MPQLRTMTLILLLVGLTACTWVKLTSEGENVNVINSPDSACERVGRTTSVGKANVASFDRNSDKVATELATLARNHGANMGGNAIVAEGPVTEEGEQTFTVYNCP